MASAKASFHWILESLVLESGSSGWMVIWLRKDYPELIFTAKICFSLVVQ